MSSWTYVVGNVSVRMMEKTDEEAEYILKTVLKHLPKVCGSERDMEIKVVNSGMITGWSSHDEFQAWTDKRGFDEYQEFNIVINAYLRDTYFDETYRAFVKWLTRLAKRLPVDDGAVKISDGWGGNIAMIDCHPFETLYESGEENWANYMRWRYYDNYRYPKELLEKYWPEVFEEDYDEDENDEQTDDVVEAKYGYWKPFNNDPVNHPMTSLCSECRYISYTRTNFCPHCGANMKG